MRATLEDRPSSVAAWLSEADSDRNISLSLLGGFELQAGRRVHLLPMTTQRLLVFLALHNRPLVRHFVSERLWLDSDEEHARGSLRVALCAIGKVEASLIEKTGGHLALGPSVSVDVHHSTGLATRAQSDLASLNEWELDEGLFSQDLLPDWNDEWILPHQERYRQLRRHALESVCERLTSLGRFAQAVQAGLAAVAVEPFGERANLLLVQAYLAEGNVGEAWRHYRAFETLLKDELGVTPSQSVTRTIETLNERPTTR